MTLTYELDIGRIKMKLRAECSVQRSFRWTMRTHRHTQQVDCTAWTTKYFTVAAWLSGSELVSINEVTLRRARFVLGWVIVCGLINLLGLSQANSAFYPQLDGNEYQPKCGGALRLGSKGRCGSFHVWMDVLVAGKTV